jgi:hypothetical protein
VALELVPLGTITIDFADPLLLPNTPAGARAIFEIVDLRIEGERIHAKKKGATAADWVVLGPEGTGTLDVRATVETDDGALVYVTAVGRVDQAGGPGTSPLYGALLYETGDERYAWLNKVQSVGKGTVDGNVLTIEVCEAR